MNKSLLIIALIVVASINISCDSSTTRTSKSPSKLDLVQNHYDPIMRVSQREYSYQLREYSYQLRNYAALAADLEDDNFEIRSTEEVSDLIERVIGTMNQVRAYLLPISQISTAYGNELANLIEDSADKEEFKVLWREYQEGVAQVMNIDIEFSRQLAKFYSYYRDVTVEEGGTLVVISEDDGDNLMKELERYERTDEGLRIEQQKLRSGTIVKFAEAIKFAKGKAN